MQEHSSTKSYQLQILVRKPVMIAIGKLGSFKFPSGHYVYTGSGKRNIEKRVARHLSKMKNLRWHIDYLDYLLSDQAVSIIGVTMFEEAECAVSQKTSGQSVVPGFGATDCRNGCGSHLKFLGAKAQSDDTLA